MVEIKTDSDLDAMREAGRVVADALAAARDSAGVGVRLLDLDEAAHAVIREAAARSPFLHYHPSFAPTPFPASPSAAESMVSRAPPRRTSSSGPVAAFFFSTRLA